MLSKSAIAFTLNKCDKGSGGAAADSDEGTMKGFSSMH